MAGDDMSQGKKIRWDGDLPSVFDALLNDDYPSARKAMGLRLAYAFDHTDGSRELKALSLSLEPNIDKCESDYLATQDEQEDTPLNRIVAMADDA